jgi:radical SAM superfamily enzyme YgiQ (UPF0313 family)
MRYQGMVYRPPSEAQSYILQVTLGCPHNKCEFCDMYRGSKFKVRPLAEALEDLDMAREHYGPDLRSIFLADGNSIILSNAKLLPILNKATELFPNLERITSYGSARFLVRKSLEEWKELRAAGLSRIHSGMESGDPVTLKKICKGATVEEMIEAGRHVKAAGFQLSEYIMVGVAGAERSIEHGIASGKALSMIAPDFVRLRTYVPRVDTPYYEAWKRGEYRLVTAKEALMETRVLVENLTSETVLLSDHMSNFWDISGKLPEDRDLMLAEIDHALTLPDSRFRPATETLIHMGL